MLNDIKTLPELWQLTEKIIKLNYPNNPFRPVLGAGKEHRPKLMIVFINPTSRNISSHKDWTGVRFPFIGRQRPWREFVKAGLFKKGDKEVLKNICDKDHIWTPEFAEKVKHLLTANDIFLTNIVKNTGTDADLPRSKDINLFRPLFQKEIELVQPEYIITVGLIPFNAITNIKNIRLSDIYSEFKKTGKLKTFTIDNQTVIPCYYPIGRGNPKEGIEMLEAAGRLI